MLVSTLAHDSPSLSHWVITDTTYRRLAELVNIDQFYLKYERAGSIGRRFSQRDAREWGSIRKPAAKEQHQGRPRAFVRTSRQSTNSSVLTWSPAMEL